MPWIIYISAGGLTFFPGTLLLVFAVLVRLRWADRWTVRISTAMAIVGIAMMAISAEAIPFWLYGVWAIACAGWFAAQFIRQRRWLFIAGCMTIGVAVAAMGLTVPYQLLPSVPVGNSMIYVVGDSISAGFDNRNGATWPTVLSTQHHINTWDLSRPGCTIAEAQDRLKIMKLKPAVVVIEIGGNDVLNRADPRKFGRDLDALLKTVQSSDRQVVMFELPLFPFDNGYGVEQRRVAGKYHVSLIPRRYFAEILASPGATVDGIHLSGTGQRAMAQLVCRVLQHP